MNQKLDKLKVLLRELFQLDQPDLDFGIYRVLHAKSGEISKFLDDDLLPQVKAAFGQYKSADKTELEKQLAELRKSVADAGLDPDDSPKVKELSAKLANESVDLSRLEGEVYDHLFGFFRRYYSEGDFLTKRVYKEGVYAIPYEGEEVKLHWANSDQYYIKTSEYLRDYAFRLNPEANEEGGEDPMRVHLRLVEAAEGEPGNVKEGEGKNRVFILESSDFIEEENGELVIKFEYRPATLTDWPDDERDGKKKPPVQKDLLKIAEDGILATEEAPLLNWISELGKSHIKADGELADYSRLRAHLNRYAARNTFDYFIHKDLGGFLRRELDFYIKNEVMHLDDIESDTAPRVEQYLSKIKVIRSIAGKIIDFVAQLEDFQKKLWLKKKFVVETSYLICVGIIPEEFFPEIIANDAQRDEWVNLLAINLIESDMNTSGYSEPLTDAFLTAFPTLLINLKYFDERFSVRLLGQLTSLDVSTDGILIHGENSQGLHLLRSTYAADCDAIYIDPPYNTDASAILYKNDYKHASWLSLIESRIQSAKPLLNESAILCLAIDDEEVSPARQLLENHFPKLVGVSVVRSNPQSRKTKGKLSPSHEYALFYGMSESSVPGALEPSEKRLARYPKVDEKGRYAWMNFIRSGNNDLREDRPKLFYPIFVDSEDKIRIPKMTWSATTGRWGEYVLEDSLEEGETAVLPIIEGVNGNVIEKNWQRGPDRVSSEPDEFRVRRLEDGKISIDFKTRMDESSSPNTWWDANEYASANYGAIELKALFGTKPFDFPKAETLVRHCLRASNVSLESNIVDFFAGSGTTAHSVINLNREDGGKRRFILIEAGEHFDSVILPRVIKVTFTPEWKDGKPDRLATAEEIERSPQMLKVLRLESYEDALNNLELKRNDAQEHTLFGTQTNDAFREQYMLRYMLDVESRGSQSLLNVEQFADPTAYKLKVKRPGSDESREVNVDLIETFNWLIGLTVQQIAAPTTFSAEFEKDSEGRLRLNGRLKQDAEGPFWFRIVTGTIPDGRRTLVIWRKLAGNTEEDNLALDEWFTRQEYSSKDSEFDLIYVNGGNNLENLRTADDLWKVRLIEEDFHRLMFDTEDV